MQLPTAWLIMTALLGCQTVRPSDDSSVSADRTATFTTVKQYFQTRWVTEVALFDKDHKFRFTGEIDERGAGFLIVDIEGEVKVQEFSALRLASAPEIAQYQKQNGETIPYDRNGRASGPFSQALAFVDEGGQLVNLMAIKPKTGDLVMSQAGLLTKEPYGKVEASNYLNSKWALETDATESVLGESFKADMSISDKGVGQLKVSMGTQSDSITFDAIRLATEAEVQTLRSKQGPTVPIDSAAQFSSTWNKALVLLNKKKVVNLLAIEPKTRRLFLSPAGLLHKL